MSKKSTALLLILDGWGHREATDSNAIANAATPTWDSLWQQRPSTLIDTSGQSVGLPAGQMGNSEVGHMNIGAGRIVYQDFTRISRAIEDGSFNENPAICAGNGPAPSMRTATVVQGARRLGNTGFSVGGVPQPRCGRRRIRCTENWLGSVGTAPATAATRF